MHVARDKSVQKVVKAIVDDETVHRGTEKQMHMPTYNERKYA